MAKAAENTNKSAKPGFGERVSNFFKGIGKSFKNMYHELKKVTWPTWEELKGSTLVVMLFSVIMGCYIAGLDVGLSWVIDKIMGRG